MIVQDLKRIPNGYENGKKLFEITSIHTNLVYGEFNFRFLLDSTYKTIGNTRQQQISMLDFLNTKHSICFLCALSSKRVDVLNNARIKLKGFIGEILNRFRMDLTK